MAIVASSPDWAVAVATFSGFTSIAVFLLTCMFLHRRRFQPIKFRGPSFLGMIGFSLALRQLVVFTWSVAPLSVPCWTTVFFTLGFYLPFAVGWIRLWLLLFAYKLQDERLEQQERIANDESFEKGWWTQRIKWTYVFFPCYRVSRSVFDDGRLVFLTRSFSVRTLECFPSCFY